MNILILSFDYPPHKGGISNVAYQVASRLNDLGEKIIVVAQRIKAGKEFDKESKLRTYRFINIFLIREIVLILLLPFLVLRHKIDVIQLICWNPGGFASYLTSKILKVPYVFHAHGEEFVDYARSPFDKIKFSLFRTTYKRLIFNNASKILAISNYTKKMLIEFGLEESKIEMVHNGVDKDRFRPDLDAAKIVARHNLKDKIVLLTVSRLKVYKGHDIVINIMPELLKQFPNLVYVIVGGGSDRQSLDELVSILDLKDNIIFAGNVDQADIPLYHNICDIYIMLTKDRGSTDEFEGFGLVFLEASSSGKPVIGANTGGIPDTIIDGETGYLVDPNKAHEVMNKIIFLLKNKELAKKMGEEGRNRILRENLTWESAAIKIRDILKSVTKDNVEIISNE